MQVIALFGLYGDYGTVCEGQLFDCSDTVAMELLKAEKVLRPDPPVVLYEKEQEKEKAVHLRNEGDRAENPLVTALCLTRNRRKHLARAIRYFLLQTYLNSELLIVADGEDVRDMVPEDPRVRLIHIEDGFNIGQKRNFGVERARGEIICHADDDDYSAPDRIADQVARLLRSGKAVTGYSAMHFTDGSQWWLYTHSDHYGIGTSLVYRKSWWSAHPFPAVQKGEDGAFGRFADSRCELVSCAAGRMMTAAIHPGNTSPHYFDEACWKRVQRPEGIGSPFE